MGAGGAGVWALRRLPWVKLGHKKVFGGLARSRGLTRWSSSVPSSDCVSFRAASAGAEPGGRGPCWAGLPEISQGWTPCTQKAGDGCCISARPPPQGSPPAAELSMPTPRAALLFCSQRFWSWASTAGLELGGDGGVRGGRGCGQLGAWGLWGRSHLFCRPLSSGSGSAAPAGSRRSALPWAGSAGTPQPGPVMPPAPRGSRARRKP